METQFDPSDYYRINAARFEAIATAAQTWLDNTPNAAIATRDRCSDAMLEAIALCASSSPDQIVDECRRIGVDVDLAKAEEFVELMNDQRYIGADIVIEVGRGFLSLESLRDQRQNDTLRFCAPAVLRYEKAIGKKQVFDIGGGQVLTLAAATFEGLSSGKQGSFHLVNLHDTLLQQDLYIITHDNVVREVRFAIRPTENQLHQRCLDLLQSRNLSTLMPFMSGGFAEEQELDDVLYDIWQQYSSSDKEPQVRQLLAEVRQRAVAAKFAATLAVEHELYLPTDDNIATFETAMGLR